MIPLLANIEGPVVLDLGPGAGNQLQYFPSDLAKKGVRKIIGVEPNRALHPFLRENVHKAGLEGLYEIVGAGAQELASLGIKQVDSVLTVKVLCSVPDQEDVVRACYALLKPGGVWIFNEHVKTHEGGSLALYQGEFHFLIPSSNQTMKMHRFYEVAQAYTIHPSVSIPFSIRYTTSPTHTLSHSLQAL